MTIENIPTAQEILFSILSNTKNDDVVEYLEEHPEEIANYVADIIEFAKFHCEAQAKAIHKMVQEPEEDLEFYKAAYPISNIK